MTSDNSLEFANHEMISEELDIPYGFQDASRRQGRESPGA